MQTSSSQNYLHPSLKSLLLVCVIAAGLALWLSHHADWVHTLSLAYPWVIAVLSLSWVISIVCNNWDLIKPSKVFGFIVFLSFLQYLLSSAEQQQRQWAQLEPERIDMRAQLKITSLVSRKDYGYQFKAVVMDSGSEDISKIFKGDKLTINVYQTRLGKALKPCDIIQGTFRIKPIHASVNLYSFDYERYAFARGLKASGYLRNLTKVEPYNLAELFCLNRFRQAFSQWVKHLLPQRQAGFVLALSIGDKTSLKPSDKQFLSQFGLIHLFVISGLHLGLIAAVTLALTSIIIRRIQYYGVYRFKAASIRLILVWVSLISSLLYLLLSGLHLPAIRAFLMLLFLMLPYAFAWSLSLSLRLMAAFVLTLLIWPLSLFDLGFFLSYFVVAVIMVFASIAIKQPRKMATKRDLADEEPKNWIEQTFGKRVGKALIKPSKYFLMLLVLQCFLSLAMLPWYQSFNGQFSAISLLLNLIAIPVVSLVFVPCGFLLLLLFVGVEVDFLLHYYAAALEGFIDLLQTLSQQSWVQYTWFTLDISSAQLIVMSFILCLSFIFLYWRQFALSLLPLALLALAMTADGLWSASKVWRENIEIIETRKPKKNMSLELFDVGQGLSIFVQSQKQSLIYDVGDAWQGGSQFKSQVAPYLMRESWRNLSDLSLILSHHDKDHIGGLADLLNVWRPSQLISPEPDSLSKLEGITLSTCTSTMNSFALGDARVDIMSLADNRPGERINNKQRNNRSCIMIISLAEHAFLVMGDLSSKAELQWLETFPEQLKSLQDKEVVLVLSHHGSRYSTSSDFLKAIRPQYALNSAGFLNRFKHPHPDVKSRLDALDIPLINTADRGQIRLKFESGRPVQLSSIRQQQENWLWRTQTQQKAENLAVLPRP